MRGRAALVTVLLTIGGAQAWAQNGPVVWEPNFDFELFPASPDPRSVSVVDGARTLERGSYGAGVLLHYSDTPLTVCMVAEEGGECMEAGSAVSSRLAADVVAAYGLGRFELRLVVPTVMTQATPLEPPMGEDGLGTTGVADLRPGVKVRLYDKGSLGVAAALDITIPTGGGGANFIGDSGVSVTPRALVDFRQGRLSFAGGIGYRWRSNTAELADVVIDDQLTWSVGGEVAVMRKLSIGASVFGVVGVVGDTGSNANPIEALASGRYWITDRLALEAGGGSGLANGVGAPDLRLFAGLRWAQIFYDADHDGIADADDRCPNDPEDKDNFEDKDGCPDLDNDKDLIADLKDKCPNDPEDKDNFEDADGCPESDNDNDGLADNVDKCPNDAEDLDAFQDDDGCPDNDNDGDKIVDRLDKCPMDPEDADSFQDDDGCPDNDNDNDKIVDASDKCPNEPETYNDFEDEDGCPEEKKLVIVTESSISLTEKIFFDYNRARIRSMSHPVLDAVAAVIVPKPEMRVRIEGHTDDQGSDEFNLQLSQRRAEAVMKYLIKKGVKAEQLEAIGFGKTRPLVEGTTEDARAQNRRVEFVIKPTE